MYRLVSVALAAIMPLAAGAQSKAVGDWTIQAIDANTVAAYTVNDSGGIFGRVCYVNSRVCVWTITSPLPCETDGEYIAISNSQAGAYAHHLSCITKSTLGQQLMRFNEYEPVNNIAATAGIVGFAVPTLDGQFRVMRFSLAGSTKATADAEELAFHAGEKSTKDLSL